MKLNCDGIYQAVQNMLYSAYGGYDGGDISKVIVELDVEPPHFTTTDGAHSVQRTVLRWNVLVHLRESDGKVGLVRGRAGSEAVVVDKNTT